MRLAVAAIGFGVVTTVLYLLARPMMFTHFGDYDDEGYMLIALKSFINHGSLYDEVFTQYGPFYYEAWGGLFSLFGVPLTHDAGRTVTLVVWLVSSLAIGLATVRVAGSVLIGIATQVLVFWGISTLIAEPMHPGGIICLLLAAIVAISAAVGARGATWSIAALGGAVAALALVKLNVGIFALAALALVCVVSYRPLTDRRWVRPAVEVGCVALPFVLMASNLELSWVRHYAVHVSCAALALVIALRAVAPSERESRELRWLVAGLLAVALAVCLAILALGTSVGGLIEGTVKQPLRQSGAFSLPLMLADRTYVYDLIALAGACAYFYVAYGRRQANNQVWAAVTGLLSIFVGLELALSVKGATILFDSTAYAGYQLALLTFTWVALIPTPGAPREETAFARLLLPPLAVFQALHAYPVAGSQLLWSAFLLVPVGAICVANGVRGLAFSLTGERERRGMAALCAVGAATLLWSILHTSLQVPLREARDTYDAATPLGLPGAASVRLDSSEARRYRRIVAAIDANCESLVMLPGMDSFYIWTELDPPSLYNATGWPTLFDATRQERVIADIRSAPGLCLLENLPLARGWGGGQIPGGPLVEYLQRGFRPVARFGAYRLLMREGAGART